MKNILIIGAGAVGQPYGHHFMKAGHKVSFFVREKYREELNNGLALYPLNDDRHKKTAVIAKGFGLYSDWSEAAEHPGGWDEIYLCISSTALRKFDFSGLKSALNPRTSIVFLQSGPEDLAFLKQHLPAEQIVQGMITLISYPAPMPNEYAPQPGIAYWLPPLTPTPFCGPKERCKAVAQTFKKSGMKATVNQKLPQQAPYPTAALMQFLSGLEASEWKFDPYIKNARLRHTTSKAIQQAFSAVSHEYGSKAPFWGKVFTPFTLQLILKHGAKVFPFDLETYLQVHFTKVNDQTCLYMNTYVELADKHNLKAEALKSLNQQAHG